MLYSIFYLSPSGWKKVSSGNTFEEAEDIAARFNEWGFVTKIK